MLKRPASKKGDRYSFKVSKVVGYRFGKIIGKGTYSKVYLVINSVNKTKLACKIINKKTSGHDYIKKFVPRELKIMSCLQHPNIVTVFKVVDSPSSVYVFMDYCEYGDLLEYIREHGAIPEDKSKTFFKQIVEAVRYLHTLDVAHRDIKCENVFLMHNDRVKLGDFGFARYCKNEYDENVLSNTFCGSASYAAPEILQGKYYDPKKYDIWALGCILYVMSTASTPFDDTDIGKMVAEQLNGSIQNFVFKWDWCSANLKCLQILLLEPNMHFRISSSEVINHPWFRSSPFKGTPFNKPCISISDSKLI